MAKVAGQPVDAVFLSSPAKAPLEQNAAGKCVAEIVQTRSSTVRNPSKLKREFSKSAAHRPIRKAIAGVIDEKEVGVRETLCTPRRILSKGRYS